MHIKSNLVCTDRFNKTYRDDLKLGYKVSIPVFTETTVSEVTPGTEPTAINTSTTPVSITVDKWYKSAVEVSDMEKIENLADYLAGGAESCGYGIAKTIDLDVSSLFSTLGGSTYPNADGATFDDTTFMSLVETLDEADVPDDGKRSLIGDPSTRIDILGIDKFVRTDYVREVAIPTGKIGKLYNCDVFISNNLTEATTGHYGVLAHRDAIGVVIQREPRSRIWDLGYKFIVKIIVDAIWGADEIRDTFGKAFYTRKK